MWSVLHRVHLNLSNVKIITAVLPVVCVTSEKEKEYRSERYS